MDIPVRPKSSGMNLTPLIDIVFLLLVFFLLTTHFIDEEGIGVRLPEAASRTERQEREVAVAITRAGEVYVRDERVPLTELAERLSRETAGGRVAVVVRGDRDVPLQVAVSVMEAAKRAGADRLVVATLRGGP